jgi:hypothetical protein
VAEPSPAAQAVLEAFHKEGLAAAIKSLADQVVPETAARTESAAQRRKMRRKLLAIAAELRGTTTP